MIATGQPFSCSGVSIRLNKGGQLYCKNNTRFGCRYCRSMWVFQPYLIEYLKPVPIVIIYNYTLDS